MTKLFSHVAQFWNLNLSNSSFKKYGLHYLVCHASYMELEFELEFEFVKLKSQKCVVQLNNFVKKHYFKKFAKIVTFCKFGLNVGIV